MFHYKMHVQNSKNKKCHFKKRGMRVVEEQEFFPECPVRYRGQTLNVINFFVIKILTSLCALVINVYCDFGSFWYTLLMCKILLIFSSNSYTSTAHINPNQFSAVRIFHKNGETPL